MEEISWSELKRASAAQIKEGECLKVTSDGEMVFYVIVKPEGEMRLRIEAICSQIDASRRF